MKRAEPERTCVGCRTVRPKGELVRIVHEPGGATVVDPSGKKPGRGAYVCPNPDCLEKAVRRKALERALKAPTPPDVVEHLRREISPDMG